MLRKPRLSRRLQELQELYRRRILRRPCLRDHHHLRVRRHLLAHQARNSTPLAQGLIQNHRQKMGIGPHRRIKMLIRRRARSKDRCRRGKTKRLVLVLVHHSVPARKERKEAVREERDQHQVQEKIKGQQQVREQEKRGH